MPEREHVVTPELGRIGRRNGLIVLGVVVLIVGGLIAFAVISSRPTGVRNFAEPAVAVGTATGDVRQVSGGVSLAYDFEVGGEHFAAVGSFVFEDAADAAAGLDRVGGDPVRVQVLFDRADPAHSRADDAQLFTELS